MIGEGNGRTLMTCPEKRMVKELDEAKLRSDMLDLLKAYRRGEPTPEAGIFYSKYVNFPGSFISPHFKDAFDICMNIFLEGILPEKDVDVQQVIRNLEGDVKTGRRGSV